MRPPPYKEVYFDGRALFVDVRDLINVPGAGRAEIALRATGIWDDGLHPDAVEWDVHLADPLLGTTSVNVKAMDEAGAIRAEWRAHSEGRVRWDRYFYPEMAAASAQAVAVEADYG